MTKRLICAAASVVGLSVTLAMAQSPPAVSPAPAGAPSFGGGAVTVVPRPPVAPVLPAAPTVPAPTFPGGLPSPIVDPGVPSPSPNPINPGRVPSAIPNPSGLPSPIPNPSGLPSPIPNPSGLPSPIPNPSGLPSPIPNPSGLPSPIPNPSALPPSVTNPIQVPAPQPLPSPAFPGTPVSPGTFDPSTGVVTPPTAGTGRFRAPGAGSSMGMGMGSGAGATVGSDLPGGEGAAVPPGMFTPVQIARSFLGADGDRDGQLTRAEAQFLTVQPLSFEQMDRDGDGILSRFEYEDALGR